MNKYVNKIRGHHNPTIQRQAVDLLYILLIFCNIYIYIYYILSVFIVIYKIPVILEAYLGVPPALEMVMLAHLWMYICVLQHPI